MSQNANRHDGTHSSYAEALARARTAHQKHDLEQTRKLLDELAASHGPTPETMALEACVALAGQNPEGVAEILEKALDQDPGTSAWAADLGFALMLSGRIEEAEKLLRKAVERPGPDAAAWTRLGGLLLMLGHDEDAAEALAKAVRMDPERAEVHVNMGAASTRLGKLEQALESYTRALRINPDMPQAMAGKSAVLVALERTGEAVLELEKRLENSGGPDEAMILRLRLAAILDAAGRLDEAAAHLATACSQDPDDLRPALQLASLEMNRTRYGKAMAALGHALEADPEALPALLMRARAAAELKLFDLADKDLEQALELEPQAPGCLLARASVDMARDDFTTAEADLDHVLEDMPGLAEAWAQRGHLKLLDGRLDQAVDDFKRASELNPTALAQLVEARSYPDDPKVVERMEDIAKNPLLHRDPRAAMGFALAKLHQKSGRYDKAFSFADLANKTMAKTIGHDADKASEETRKIIRAWTPELLNRLTPNGSGSRRPVFIMGMPRSGTTLTEQILCSHPMAAGAGELGFIPALTRLTPLVLKTRTPYPDCMELFKGWMAGHAARYYLSKTAPLNPDGLPRVADKLPHNFMHAGLIRAAFPNAAIILVRRDPRDVAVSNYFTNFKYKYAGLSYAFDLTDIGRALLDFRDITDHWLNNLRIEMYELDYDRLVAEPEPVVRELLDHVGLPWDDAVMDFHTTKRAVKTASAWQVRQPLYTSSSKRWKNYENFLAPLTETLEQGGWHLD